MGNSNIIPPQFGVPIPASELVSTIPTSILYGVTPSDEFIPIKIQPDGTLDVNATFSGSITIGEIGIADKSSFAYGTDLEQPVGGVYQDVNPTLSSGKTGAVRLTQYRAFHVNLRDSSGVEISPATETTSTSILTALDQFKFNGNALLVDVAGTSGIPINQFEENLAVPGSSTTTLYSFTVPGATTYQLHGFIGWGTFDGEWLVAINGANAGGGWSSPTNRTLQVDYGSFPILASAGDIVTITITNFATSIQTFRLNVLADLIS